ncbi:unnamed protein product [Meganyctiphanes norvegica]|uniref:C-type lectin domain-containing protein n=1 Tax=Meganyctiphanes norvegica TaxID=48144 RepID=A0AAV2RC81_MEGNR
MLKYLLCLTLLILLLMNHETVQANGLDEYYGREVDYDYFYGDDDYASYGDVDSPGMEPVNKNKAHKGSKSMKFNNKMDNKGKKDNNKNEHIIIASKYIGEIDARGSTITIHDNGKDKNNPKELNIVTSDTEEESNIESSMTPIPIVTDGIENEEAGLTIESLISVDDGDDKDGNIEDDGVAGDDDAAASGEDDDNSDESDDDNSADSDDSDDTEDNDVDSDEDDDAESEDVLPPITIKNFGNTEDNLVDKIGGLQLGMKDIVIILKEIAEKVGCSLKGLQNDSPQCQAPFIQVDSGECLYIDLEKKLSWNAARFACNKLEASLVHPLNHGQDLDFVKKLIPHIAVPSSPVWVGGSDRQHEGAWHWVDGRGTPSNLAWSPGHPQHVNGREDCMAMSLVNPQGLKASNCQWRKHYVCQKKFKKT